MLSVHAVSLNAGVIIQMPSFIRNLLVYTCIFTLYNHSISRAELGSFETQTYISLSWSRSESRVPGRQALSILNGFTKDQFHLFLIILANKYNQSASEAEALCMHNLKLNLGPILECAKLAKDVVTTKIVWITN